ncbi:MAG: hypothetical protein FWC39_07355 [Bacteroidetes bacterium]|nr:hypothetical protein [Bacteroidota bacterium]
MNSIKTANILLIVLVVFFVGSAIWNIALVNAVAKQASKATGGVKEFTGNPHKLAQGLIPR